jgi:hypothetical protein
MSPLNPPAEFVTGPVATAEVQASSGPQNGSFGRRPFDRSRPNPIEGVPPRLDVTLQIPESRRGSLRSLLVVARGDKSAIPSRGELSNRRLALGEALVEALRLRSPMRNP